ncbi:MAG: zinc ribbon domain-containing protein [Bacilli bacterium]|jgi:hypothetical protein
MSQYCKQCGYLLPDGADFCPRCGAKIHKSDSTSGAVPSYAPKVNSFKAEETSNNSVTSSSTSKYGIQCLIVGFVALICSFFTFIGFIPSIAAIAGGIKYCKQKTAVAGLCLGVVALVISFLSLFSVI